MTEKLAIYVHVPFCRQRCTYCHFDIKVFHPRTDPHPFHERFQEAVLRELETRARGLENLSVGSVFFGGGTPSRLNLEEVGAILEAVARHYRIDEGAEITLEVNPEDASHEYLAELRVLGVTRLSFGVQTFDDAGLRAINRAHDSKGAIRALEERPVFPDGASIDLILGLPHQTEATLQRDLSLVSRFDLEHVSLYLLERDLPTPLDKRHPSLPDGDRQADFYDFACDTLEGIGLEAYEISNFCRRGRESRHNLVYWRCGDYLGIGPAACSRIGRRFRRNIPNLTPYCERVEKTGQGIAEEEHWCEERFRQEQIIQGLRLREGVPLVWLEESELSRLEPHRDAGLCEVLEGCLRLTRAGRLLANEVFEVFID